MYDEYAAAAEKVRPFVADTGRLLNDILAKGGSVMFEGAQGTMLDIDHGTYPFVTSSSRNGRRRGNGNRCRAHGHRHRHLRDQGLRNARWRRAVPYGDDLEGVGLRVLAGLLLRWRHRLAGVVVVASDIDSDAGVAAVWLVHRSGSPDAWEETCLFERIENGWRYWRGAAAPGASSCERAGRRHLAQARPA